MSLEKKNVGAVRGCGNCMLKGQITESANLLVDDPISCRIILFEGRLSRENVATSEGPEGTRIIRRKRDENGKHSEKEKRRENDKQDENIKRSEQAKRSEQKVTSRERETS